MLRYILLIIILTYYSNTFGQIIEQFDLVKSFQSKEDKSKPAILSFTFPKESDPSFLINAALGVDIIGLFNSSESEPTIGLSPFLEYNRNTLIGKEQHQLQAGLSFEWLIKCGKFTPTIEVDAKYVNDFKDTIESFQSELLFSPKVRGVDTELYNFYIPDNYVRTPNNEFGFEYIPYVGLETENRFKTENDSLQGHILRFMTRLQSNLYFFPRRDTANSFLYHLLEFNLDYQFRYELFNTSLKDFLPNNHFLELSLNYVIYKGSKVEVKLGIDYVYGANPVKGFEEQEYWGLSLKIKL